MSSFLLPARAQLLLFEHSVVGLFDQHRHAVLNIPVGRLMQLQQASRIPLLLRNLRVPAQAPDAVAHVGTVDGRTVSRYENRPRTDSATAGVSQQLLPQHRRDM